MRQRVATSFPACYGCAASVSVCASAPPQTLTLLLPLSGGPTGSRTIACPAGGGITLERSGSHELDGSGTGSMTFTLTQVQRGCVVVARGQRFVIDGDPGITITGTMKLANRLPVESTMRESGGFRWSVGERSGNCQTDVTRKMTFSPTPSGSVQGTGCGVAVSHEMSW